MDRLLPQLYFLCPFPYSVVDMNDITSKLVREQNGNSTENLGKKWKNSAR